jgi:16S rRNA (adenine1518-N6/adenine1519-N6)-dimethyltransferase
MTERGPSPTARSTLRAQGLRPRKRLGQNFLRDTSFLPRILAALELRDSDQVVEIGSGTGVLTEALASAGARITGVELDDSLLQVLETRFDEREDIRFWHGSALSFDPCRECDGPYKLAGNIPYYITGPLIRHFLETACPPQLLVLMVQREVAERMRAGPGDLSLLGVSVQIYAQVEVIARVPSAAFFPPPKVESAIVRLRPYVRLERVESLDAFFSVVRAGFSAKRKQLANSLAGGLGVPREQVLPLLSRTGIDPKVRAEDLSIDDWKRLTRAWVEAGG